jgi:hypothetical protein
MKWSRRKPTIITAINWVTTHKTAIALRNVGISGAWQ